MDAVGTAPAIVLSFRYLTLFEKQAESVHFVTADHSFAKSVMLYRE